MQTTTEQDTLREMRKATDLNDLIETGMKDLQREPYRGEEETEIIKAKVRIEERFLAKGREEQAAGKELTKRAMSIMINPVYRVDFLTRAMVVEPCYPFSEFRKTLPGICEIDETKDNSKKLLAILQGIYGSALVTMAASVIGIGISEKRGYLSDEESDKLGKQALLRMEQEISRYIDSEPGSEYPEVRELLISILVEAAREVWKQALAYYKEQSDIRVRALVAECIEKEDLCADGADREIAKQQV